ncbi:mycoredoxin [Actinobaculum suis]|uniref:mycoredoxin n=1 Tax=Actinobaculum suis TaxID=1657 RepID=UPI000809FF4E|nr:mycoredoxin [Actinobaculum suis]OCA95736.1 glutaredoxin-like protein [Actinobaculum suis]
MANMKMYTTTWCGYCKVLKRQLERAGITWEEINIEEAPGAAEHVALINGGDQIVPTLEFADGSTLTNPSLKEVQERLASLGE